MNRIWLIRHGMPEYGTEGSRCIGVTDLPLSGEGEAAMMRMGLRAAEQDGNFLRSALFFCSPLKRAVSSGEAFLQGASSVDLTLKDKALVQADGFSEVDLGSWEGLSFREIRERFPEAYRLRGENPGGYRTPGGETLEEAGQRFFKTLLQVAEETGKDLVIFGHSGAMGAGLSILEHRSADGYRNYFKSFGGIMQLSMTENGRIIRVDERVFI